VIKLLVAGTVAYDSIETPFGKAGNVLGGVSLIHIPEPKSPY
jgi:hypothetical protein